MRNIVHASAGLLVVCLSLCCRAAAAEAGDEDVSVDWLSSETGRSEPSTPGDPAEGDAASAGLADMIPVEPLAGQAEGADEVRNETTAARLDDLVVTATKRAESQRTIASTVNVLTGEDLEKINARELQDYLRYVPGITLQEGETNDTRTISIRGIGPQPGANTTTGVLVENVSMGDPYASYLVPDLDPFDLRDLEILKGPQGTLFGAAALNGAIRYVLNKPQLYAWETRAFVNWLDVSQGTAEFTGGAALNVPLGDTIALRGAAVLQDVPGLYDNINANGRRDIDADTGDKKMYRALGLWQPHDKLRVNAFYLYQRAKRDDLSLANNHDGEFNRSNTPGESHAIQAFDIANLDAQYDFDWATLIAEASYSTKFQRAYYDGSAIVEPLAVRGIETLRLHKNVESDATSYELRLVSPDADEAWVWLAGAYMNRFSAYVTHNTPVANTQFLGDLLGALGFLDIPGDPLGLLFPTPDGLSLQYIQYDPLEATEQSLFGEVTRRFFDGRLALSVGGRLYRQELTATIDLDGVLAPYGDLFNYSGDRRLESQGFNPKASVKFQWTDDVLLYGTVARGFQFGGLNDPAPIPTDNVYPLTYKPSTIWSYETGVRTDWFDNTLQIDLTGFVIDWTDMQLRQGAPSGNTDYTDNVSRARSVGAEMALRWLTPINGLMLVNSASYIDATVEEPYTTSDGFDVPKGTTLPASPHLQTTTGLIYTMFLGPIIGDANLTYSYIGPAWNTVTHQLRIFDYGTLDAGINLRLPALPLSPEIAVSMTNVTDERALIGGRYTQLVNAPLAELGIYNRPRAIAVRISGRF